jgi:hypothetical protein
VIIDAIYNNTIPAGKALPLFMEALTTLWQNHETGSYKIFNENLLSSFRQMGSPG